MHIATLLAIQQWMKDFERIAGPKLGHVEDTIESSAYYLFEQILREEKGNADSVSKLFE
jgi:hypothetical protein